MIVGTGDFCFEHVADWPRVPPQLNLGAPTDAAVNSAGHVYILSRDTAHPVTIWDADGNFIGAWGTPEFSAVPHGITIAPDDTVWIVDRDAHVATKFSASGE